MPRPILEVAVGSVADAQAAAAGGADRLELNSALALGGLTPTYGLVHEVLHAVTLPVIAMVRPRPSGCSYSAAEFLVMRRDLEQLLSLGVAGVAFGLLTAAGTVDVPRCRTLLQQIGDQATAVWHRAFDLVPDAEVALEALIDAGVKRVMTSGLAASATDGILTIAKLVEQARGRIEILPAGGIRPANVLEIVTKTGCTQVHAGLRKRQVDPTGRVRPGVRFGTADDESYEVVDAEAVRKMRSILG